MPVRHLKWRTSQEIFLRNKLKTLHLYVFGYKAHMFLSIEICTNKLIPHSKLIIFIGYKDDEYYFICHIQGNIIFCSTHVIFDEEIFSKCTNSHAKEHKLYDKLLDKTSPETESLVPNSSGNDGPTLVPILHTLIPPTHFSSPFLSSKSISPPSTPEPKKPIINIEETNNIDSDVKM